jgi:DNA polymerase-3 subunit beta
MKATVESKALGKALASLIKVIDGQATMPILRNVRIVVSSGNAVQLTGTDLNTWMSIELEGTRACEPGAYTVDARQLQRAIKGADGQLAVTAKDTGGPLIVSGEGVAVNLPGLPAADYPKDPTYIKTSAVDAESFARMFRQVLPCASTDETRYHLNGVYLERHDQDGARLMRMVATDGHRLTRVRCAVGYSPDAPGILPRIAARAMADLLQRAAKARGIASFGMDAEKGYARLDTGDAMITTKLVEAQYPPVDQVLPKDVDNWARFNLGELATAADAIASAQGKKHPGSCIAWRDARALWSAVNLDGDANVETARELALLATAERSGKISVMPRYLEDALAACLEGSAEYVELGLTGELDPISIRCALGNLEIVVMPMRLDPTPAVTKFLGAAPPADAPAKASAPAVASSKATAKASPAKVAAKAPEAPPAEKKIKITAVAEDGTRTAVNPDAPIASAAQVAPDPMIGLALVDAFRALHARDALACYRCGSHTHMGYVLEGVVCCRACRPAHSEAYHAARGTKAPTRHPRRFRREDAPEGVQVHKVAGIIVHAEHVEVRKG